MAAMSTAERVSALRQRREEQGLVRLELWVHPNDVSRVKRDAKSHAARRARLLKQGLVVASLEEEAAPLTRVKK